MANYPQICADLKKIKHNVDMLCALCAEYGVSVAAVTKVVSADERIVRVLEHSAATMLADARTENLARLQTKKPKLLLRAPSPEEAVETVIEAMRGDADKIASESADLLYHLLVLWADAGLTPDDVRAKLEAREGTSGIAEKKARGGAAE